MRRAIFALALLIPATASAQTPPPIQDWSKTETVVVSAEKGPAVWHIEQNGAHVWILPTVAPVPLDLQWNSDGIEDAIRGANAVYLPPTISANFWEVSWFILTKLGELKQPDDQSLRASLPPELRARFQDWLTKVGDDPAEEYDDYLAAIAALRLEDDYHKKMKLDGRPIEWRISGLAELANVKTVPIATYKAIEIADEVQLLSPEDEQHCMKDALDDLDTLALHAEAAAHAWAVGDVAGIKANYSEEKLYQCMEQTRAFADDRERSIADTVAVIKGALAKPGHTVVVVGIGIFLRKNGVADRLAAEGIKVEGPPG